MITEHFYLITALHLHTSPTCKSTKSQCFTQVTTGYHTPQLQPHGSNKRPWISMASHYMDLKKPSAQGGGSPVFTNMNNLSTVSVTLRSLPGSTKPPIISKTTAF